MRPHDLEDSKKLALAVGSGFAASLVALTVQSASDSLPMGAAIALPLSAAAAWMFRRRCGQPDAEVVQALDHWAETGRPPSRTEIDAQDPLGKALLRVAHRERSIHRGLARLGPLLAPLPEQLRTLAETTGEGDAAIEEGVEETASLLSRLNQSILSIHGEVEGLGTSAEGITTSALEMGASIDAVAESAATLHDVNRGAAAAVHQMNARTEEASESANGVLGMAEESAAAMVQMDRAIQEVNQHAADASALTDRVRTSADAGVTAMNETVRGIDNIRSETTRARDVIVRLEERIREIDEIVNVIGSINDETNLLSLNAAIIAAQAGEQGKAFGVVAHHVKMLANRTGKSTQEIAALVRDVQDQARDAVDAIGAGMGSVENGVTLSRRAGVELGEIRTAAQEASERVTGIARATEEQSRNSNHVARAAQETSNMVLTITSILTEQRAASSALLDSAQSALTQCDGVRRTTEEQRETARFIANAVASITEVIKTVQASTKSHTMASEAASASIGKIMEAAERHGASPEAIVAQIDAVQAELTEMLGNAGSGQGEEADASSATDNPA